MCAASQRTAVPAGVAQELLEARSKAAVLAAELDKSRAEAAAAAQQMQVRGWVRGAVWSGVAGCGGRPTIAKPGVAGCGAAVWGSWALLGLLR